MQLSYDTFCSRMYEAADYVRGIIGTKVDIAIALGSGFGGFVEKAFMAGCTTIDYNRIPFMPKVSVSGHSGKIYVGNIDGKTVMCFGGRFHSYEGHTPPTMTILPYLAWNLGARIYIATNAAGGTKKSMEEGCIMLITNNATSTRWNPLYGYESCQLEQDPSCLLEAPTLNDLFTYLKQPNMFRYPSNLAASSIYSTELQSLARTIARSDEFIAKSTITLRGRKHVVKLHEGTYILNSGPNYETTIETKSCMDLAPGAVGMSSVPEILAARALGMHAIGFSIITNLASGLSREQLTHEDVKVVGDAMCTAVWTIVESLLKRVNIPRLPFLSPLRPKVATSALIPETETLPKKEAAQELISQTPGLEKVRFCLLVASPIYFFRPVGPCLLVSIPLNLPLQQIIATYEASLKLGIGVFLVLDRSLATPGLVRIENVMNYTAVHGPCLTQLEGQGTTVFNKSAHAYLSTLANSTSLLVVETIENPNSVAYFNSMIAKAGITAATNGFHFGVVAVARALGIKSLFVGAVQEIQSICNDPRFVSVLTTSAKVTLNYLVAQKHKFSIFEDVAQLSYEHAERIVNEIRTYVIASFDNALLIDTVHNKIDLTKYRHLSVSSPLDIYLDVHTGILIFVVPNISNTASLAEMTFPARICQLLGVKRVIAITDQTKSKDISCVTDVYNVAGLNSLRGHNDSRWGPQFIDVSSICNKGIYMDLQRMGCRSAIAVLTCSPLCVLTDLPYASRRGFVVIGSACLMSMFDLAQAKIPAGAIVGPDLQRSFDLAHKFLQTMSC